MVLPHTRVLHVGAAHHECRFAKLRPFLPPVKSAALFSVADMVHEDATALQRGNNSSQIERTCRRGLIAPASCGTSRQVPSSAPSRDTEMVSVIEDLTPPFQLQRAAKKRKGIANSYTLFCEKLCPQTS